MTTANTHIIQRQSVGLQLSSQADSWELQQLVVQVLQSSAFQAAVDAVLSDFAPADGWLEINAISIDLGVLQKAAFEQQFSQRLPELLRSQLSGCVPIALHKGDATVRSAQQSVLETFLYFLHYGAWPSAAPAPEGLEELENQLLAALPKASETQLTAIKETLKKQVAGLRLVRQFSDEIRLEVLKLLAPPNQPGAAGRLWQFNRLKGLPDSPAAEKIWHWVLQQVAHHREAALKEIEGLLSSLAQSQALTDPPVLAAVHALITGKAEESAPQISSLREESKNPNGAGEEAHDDLQETRLPEEAYYIRNAGVVLLHPFLSTCFEACGWLEDGSRFARDPARTKAMLLIHFLATGKDKAPEYALLLPKLLCCAPLQVPLQGHVRLTGREKAEGTALLEAAIKYWSVLKNTSPEGLREGFLQREGKIKCQADGPWVLAVEQKAQDILLDRLPYGWGISMLQLPWMDCLLKINWM